MSYKTKSGTGSLPVRVGRLSAVILGCAVCCTPQLKADEPSSKSDARAVAVIDSDDEQPRKLSAAPLDYPLYPDDRPMWVDQPDRVEEKWAELVVQSVPSLSSEKSLESLAEQQQIAVSAYVDQLIGVDRAGENLYLTPEQIEATLVDPERTYGGKLTTSTGEMYQHAGVLILDEGFHEEVVQQWKASEVAERLKGLGVLAALALVGLTGLTVLLKSVSPCSTQEQDDTAALA